MSEWQKIRTAPRDGEAIDVWVLHKDRKNGGVRQTYVSWNGEEWIDLLNRSPVEGFFNPVTGIPLIRATHWMPIPKPPKGDE